MTSRIWPSAKSGHEFYDGAGDLKRLIDKTRFAISTEETRYYLNGIYLHPAEMAGTKTLRAVATDGHRLAQVELPLPKARRTCPASSCRGRRCTSSPAARRFERESEGRRVTDKVRFEIGPSF